MYVLPVKTRAIITQIPAPVDNVTHTLIGLIAGESAAAETSAAGLTAQARRALSVAVAVIGSNSPDLDLLMSYGAPGNLGYALWHRGYTHTVLGCLALALLLYGGAEAFMRYRQLVPSRRDRRLLFAVALFSTGLHLVMDYLNSYGVHPFWPVANRWSYGDSVFIVEPLYWVAAAPLLFWLRTRLARALFGSALLAVLAIGAWTRLLTPASCALVALGAPALAFAGKRLALRGAARLAVALALAVTSIFVLAAHAASSRAAALARGAFPEDRTLDRVLTPLPSNPLCWDLILVTTHADRYLARHAMLALTPGILKAHSCPAMRAEEHTAPLTAVAAADSDGVRWFGEYRISRSEFASRVAMSCEARAFMLFARAPFLADSAGSAAARSVSAATTAADEPAPGRASVLGDLRFDRGQGRGSFEVTIEPLKKLQNCPRAAPWIAPRADLAPAR